MQALVDARVPFASPRTASNVTSLFSWSNVRPLLASEPAPDVLTVRSGRPLPERAPRDDDGLRQMLSRGTGVVVRRAEQHDEGLKRLAGAFETSLSGRAHVQLFVTAAGTNGFGWHYDAEEVFIVQTVGVKTYFFRENTLDPGARGTPPDFAAVARETTPLLCTTLVPGDWLYLPRGFWHVAKAVEESFSISIGVA